MVAIVTGGTLGLSNSSLSILGQHGAQGQAALGRDGERVYVNSSTGNLVIQAQDEYLTSSGLDLALIRTYNSQGLLDDDNGDNWRLNVHTRVYGLTGNVNSVGSTVIRVGADGAEFRYVYDAALGKYISTDGDGAHDTLQYAKSTKRWTWTDGTPNVRDLYDSNGRLIESRDADNNVTAYGYTGSLLTQITDASGQITYLDYAGTNLIQIRAVSEGITQTTVRYTCDSLNRLSQVIVDLSPEDNSISDGKTYITTYTYDGTSNRVASIMQGDGTTVSFTYVQVGTDWKVATVTDGEGNVTQIGYHTDSTATTEATTATADPSVLSSTDGVTQSDPYSLNTSRLSTSPAWSMSFNVSGPQSSVSSPYRTAFNTSGQGIAVWGEEDGNLYGRSYDPTGGWGNTEVLGFIGVSDGSLELAVDSQGNAIVLWPQANGGIESIYASSFSVSTGWSGQELLADRLSSKYFQIAFADNGEAVAVWTQPPTTNGTFVDSIVGAHFDPASGWSAGDELLLDRYVGSLQLKMNSNGTALVYYTDGASGAYSCSYGSLGWGEEQYVGGSSDGVIFLDDDFGAGTAVYTEITGTYPDQIYTVYAHSYATSGWGAREAIATLGPSAYSIWNLNAVRDATGNILVSWEQGDWSNVEICTNRYVVGSGWQTASRLASANDHAQLAMDASGDGFLLWSQDDVGSSNVYVRRFVPDTGWDDPVLIGAGTAFDAKLAVAADGNATVLRTDSDGSVVLANRYSPALGWSQPEIVGFGAAYSGELFVDANGHMYASWLSYDSANTYFYANTYGAPYYSVRQYDTWETIATSLYGTANVADELREYYASVTLAPTGVRLGSPPAILNDRASVVLTIRYKRATPGAQ